MNSKQRIQAVLRGEPTDRIPNTGWVHTPSVDRSPKDMALATKTMQAYFRWDIVKVMQGSSYFLEDYNSSIEFYSASNQKEQIVHRWPVNHPQDLLELEVNDPHKPGSALAREVETVQRTVELMGGEVPVLPTLFSPLGLVRELSGSYQRGELLSAFIKYNTKELTQALDVVLETSKRLVDAYIAAGADGIFFAQQLPDRADMDDEAFEKFAVAYDKALLEYVQKKSWVNIMHIHSQRDCRLEELLAYPVEIVNFGEEYQGPDYAPVTLAQIRAKTDRVLIQGYQQKTIFYQPDNNREAVKERLAASLERAISENGGTKGLIFGPECALPTNLPKYLFTLPAEVIDDYMRQNG